MGSLVVKASDSRPEGLDSMPPNTLRAYSESGVSPSIVPLGNFAELIRIVTWMVLKVNDRRTSSPLPR
ncbi:hypothetical protein TNCV_3125491 [Trichonephila clavipes]|nr:hypothetical protein TNCV_3125491 [Trichonephila clavipes]